MISDIRYNRSDWKREDEEFGYDADTDTILSTPLIFDYKVSEDVRTSFPQIYLDGYNPATKRNTGSLLDRVPDRNIYIDLQDKLHAYLSNYYSTTG